jgi:hypothetical protein
MSYMACNFNETSTIFPNKVIQVNVGSEVTTVWKKTLDTTMA